jgi:CMP-N-acetylneuraminic acid synthetase
MKYSQPIIALIPARGGSRAIPSKNIRFLGGVPLIAYSIAAAKQSRHIERVIVSTDDEIIAEVAMEWGAEVPFFRPANLGGEEEPGYLPIVRHALRWLELRQGYRADIVALLRPGMPFRPQGLLDEAIEALLAHPDADSVRSVTPSGQNPFKMWRIENEALSPLLHTDLHEPYNRSRHSLPSVFWQTGHVEAIRYQTIMEKKSLTGDVALPCLVEPEYAIPLDSLPQWRYAEHLLSSQELSLVLPQGQLCQAA